MEKILVFQQLLQLVVEQVDITVVQMVLIQEDRVEVVVKEVLDKVILLEQELQIKDLMEEVILILVIVDQAVVEQLLLEDQALIIHQDLDQGMVVMV